MGGLQGKRSSSLCVKFPKKNIKHHPLKHSSSLELLKLQQSANPPMQPMPVKLTPSNHAERALLALFLQCSKDKMSAAEVLSEEEEDGDAIMRGDDVDEDKEGSDTSSFVMHVCLFFSDERSLFVSFL